MNVIVNKKNIEVEENISIKELLDFLQIDGGFCAVAIGNKIVKKTQWVETKLTEGDNITIINATCGG